jgi:hypothetical protein
MPIDVVGWDDVSGDDSISGDDYSSGDDFVSGSDEDLRNLLAVSGDVDISGDDAMMSGAMMPNYRQQMMRAARKMAARAAMRRGGVAVRNRGVTAARRFPLGFVSGSIPPGGFADVKANPQIAFRAERLVIPNTLADFFSIVDLKVGNRSQFVSSGEVPALVFSEQGVGIALRMDTAQVSQDVVISVRNITDTFPTPTAAFFRAALIGTAIL